MDSEDFIPFDFSDGEEESFQKKTHSSPVSSPNRKRKRNEGQRRGMIDLSVLPPWLKNKSIYKLKKNQNYAQLLHKEIVEFVKFISPSPEEHQMRRWVVQRIESVVKWTWPEAQVHVFGSFDTKLYLPTSDIDLVILGIQSAKSIKNCLYKLAFSLKKKKVCEECTVISRARVPIVKFVESVTNISVDISLGISSGIESGNIIKEFLTKVPAIKPLLMVLKQFLVLRNMNEVYTGGLGSYSSVILILSFLQMHPKIQNKSIRPEDNLGVLLLEFFEMYGKLFNYEAVGISVRNGGTYFDKMERGWDNPQKPYLLSIEDPQDPTNDVSKSSHGIQRVRQIFSLTHDLLTQKIYIYHQQCYQKSKTANQTNSIKTILGSILAISDKVIQHRDHLIQEYYRGTFQRLLNVQYHSDVDEPPKYQKKPIKAPKPSATSSEFISLNEFESSEEDSPPFVAISTDSDDPPLISKVNLSRRGRRRN